MTPDRIAHARKHGAGRAREIDAKSRERREREAFLRGEPIGSPDRPAMIGGQPFVAREASQPVNTRARSFELALDSLLWEILTRAKRVVITEYTEDESSTRLLQVRADWRDGSSTEIVDDFVTESLNALAEEARKR